jgi:hypothetical protein
MIDYVIQGNLLQGNVTRKNGIWDYVMRGIVTRKKIFSESFWVFGEMVYEKMVHGEMK